MTFLKKILKESLVTLSSGANVGSKIAILHYYQKPDIVSANATEPRTILPYS